jgi:ankyrin repeat protein
MGMRGHGRFAAAVLLLASSAAWVSAQGPSLDAELERGIRMVDEGNFDAGIKTLDTVASRLKAEGGKASQLSRAYLYLGIANLQLSHEQAARARFAEAVKTDHKLVLSEYEFPPPVVKVFDEAKKRVEEEARPTLPPRKVPPSVFFEAVKSGDFALVRSLLSEDASLVSARDEEFGATPLHWAALRGQSAVAALLVAEGANLGARNSAGETPQDVARRQKNDDMFRILTPPAPAGGTIFEAAKTGDVARIRELLKGNASLVGLRDTAFGATPLQWASLRGHVEAVRALLAEGADVGALNNDGETALDVARRAKRSDVVEVLRAASTDPRVRFFDAVRSGDAAATEQLLAQRPDLVKERDSTFGATALHWAALRGHADVARVLLQKGADRSARNTAGETPLDIARRAKRTEVEAILK